jgi:hypothetical protein
MKWDDYISKGDKEQNTSSFLFSTSKSLSFFVSKMSAKESFVENLQRQSREKLQKLKKEQERQRKQ